MFVGDRDYIYLHGRKNYLDFCTLLKNIFLQDIKEDKQIWVFNSDGKYHVKNSYRVLTQDLEVDSRVHTDSV